MNSTRPWEKSYPSSLHNYTVDIQALPDSADKLLMDAAKEHTDSPAFSVVLPVGMHQDLSFKDVDKWSNAFAAYLIEKEQLSYGDVIALQLPNSLNYPVAVLGAWKAGLIVTNVNPLYTARELEAQLMDSGAKLLVACDLFVERAETMIGELGIPLITTSIGDFFDAQVAELIQAHVAENAGSSLEPSIAHRRFMDVLAAGQEMPLIDKPRHPIALYQYTGGTTGKSKGAVLTHVNLLATLQMAEDFFTAFDAELALEGAILTVLPLYHIFAFTLNFMLFFKVGVRNLLIPNPRPLSNLKPAFEQFDIHWMTGVDTLYAGLLTEPWFNGLEHTLKYAIAGGTALRPSTATSWQDKVCTIFEGYGLTETCCILSVHPPIDEQRPGSVGLPMPGSNLKLVDERGEVVKPGQPGEIVIKGPHVIQSYLNRPQETEAAIIDGWFLTGDIAEMDEDGFLRIVDRKKDMILVSGFNVYPNEIETIIAKHHEVIDVAVIGVPDENTGEALRAVISPGSKHLSAQDIIEHCREYLTGYKVPKQVVFMEDLPKSPIGKILRAEVRKMQ